MMSKRVSRMRPVDMACHNTLASLRVSIELSSHSTKKCNLQGELSRNVQKADKGCIEVIYKYNALACS